MATKTVKKNETPKITKKWYTLKLDTKTLRPIRFSWSLSSGYKEVFIYNDNNKPDQDIEDINLRNCITSYYFAFDKSNKRIFAYPIRLTGHDTRSSCPNAHWELINTYSFYMWDENKQLWEVPYTAYRKQVRYDYQNRTWVYKDVSASPRKATRLSTYNYKIQCQLTSYIRSIFSELYGNDFIYQNKLITDQQIRDNHWYWINWLQAKGRKYSEKTIKAVNDLMNKFSPECRTIEESSTGWYTDARLETINGITAICYFSSGKETFRQILNEKTGKMEYFIWKNDKWQKHGRLSEYQNLSSFKISNTYRDTHQYDYKFLLEAQNHYTNREDDGRYWHSSTKNLYDFALNYISKPVIHQLLQIQNEDSRKVMYKNFGNITNIYGTIPNRGKTMFAKLGVNKYQFDNPDVIPYVKKLFGQNNISHMDNQTWDKCTNTFKRETGHNWYDTDIIDFLKSQGEFSLDRWIKICTLSQQFRNQDRYSYSDSIKQLYKDYYRSLNAMVEFGLDISSYPLLFNDKIQLQRYHDEAARAISNVRNRAQDEKFEMLYAKREKMLENDGKYLISMPKCSADLTHEGSYLHHCVGGYVNSVANGSTAIYFLRKASAPNEPWLTVEVANKNCRQIHGACNAWMGSKDEYFDAVPFLVWWFDKHEIVYNDNLLTNKATGYGSISDRRAMPTEAINAYKALRKLKKSS